MTALGIDTGGPVVALAGDWHGNLGWAWGMTRKLADRGITRIYHLGDFGVWPGDTGTAYLDKLNGIAEYTGVEIWVTPGNHEDYDQIDAVPVGREGLQWIRPALGLIPRGHRWTHGGRSFVSLGGAPSIDYEGRTLGRDWWKGEMITAADVEKVAAGGHADVMLAHDAPADSTRQVREIVHGNPQGWSVRALRYVRDGRKLLEAAASAVQPKLFAHGHYHVTGDTGPRQGTRFVALNCDDARGNTAELRLSDLAVSWSPGVWS